jgi:hypothetical protein
MSKTPVQLVKEQFGDKAKLIEALKNLTTDDLWLGRTSKKGLERVSNAKLLRLFSIFTAVKGEFSTRQKLIDAVLELEKRTKDAGFQQKLGEYPVPRLYDMYKSAKKRAAAAAKRASTQAGEAKSASPG